MNENLGGKGGGLLGQALPPHMSPLFSLLVAGLLLCYVEVAAIVG
jgi:hypothetical protein